MVCLHSVCFRHSTKDPLAWKKSVLTTPRVKISSYGYTGDKSVLPLISGKKAACRHKSVLSVYQKPAILTCYQINVRLYNQNISRFTCNSMMYFMRNPRGKKLMCNVYKIVNVDNKEGILASSMFLYKVVTILRYISGSR